MSTYHQSHWVLHKIAETAVPQSRIDLWPKIGAQANLSAKGSQRKNKAAGLLRRNAAYALATGIVLFGALACVPSARALSQQVIQKMGIAFANITLFDRSSQSGEAIAIISTNTPQSQSLAEVKQQLSFKLLVPEWLPAGLDSVQRDVSHYTAKSGAGSGVQVGFTYSRSGDAQLAHAALLLEANDGPISAPPLLAEGQEQSVTVNGNPGYYAHGGWQNDGTGDPKIKLGSLQWDSQADNAYLTWTQGGVTYLLEANDLDLDMNDLLKIASSMK